MPVAIVSFLFSADRQFDRQNERRKVTKSNNVERKFDMENKSRKPFPPVVNLSTSPDCLVIDFDATTNN